MQYNYNITYLRGGLYPIKQLENKGIIYKTKEKTFIDNDFFINNPYETLTIKKYLTHMIFSNLKYNKTKTEYFTEFDNDLKNIDIAIAITIKKIKTIKGIRSEELKQ